MAALNKTNIIQFNRPELRNPNWLISDITLRRHAIEIYRANIGSANIPLNRIAARILQKAGINGQICHSNDDQLIITFDNAEQANKFARVALRTTGINVRTQRALLCLNLLRAELTWRARLIIQERLAGCAALLLSDADQQIKLTLPDQLAISALVELHEAFFGTNDQTGCCKERVSAL